MTKETIKEAAKEYWASFRDVVLTVAGVGGLFASMAATQAWGWVGGFVVGLIGFAAIQAVWDGIAQRARAKAMIETINMMAKDGGFSAELRVTHRDERSTIHLKAAEETK